MKPFSTILPQVFRFFLLIITLTFVACGEGDKIGSNNEGQIEYDTKGVDPNHPLYGFAPSEATMRYKKDKFIIEMSTMGMFNTSIIVDNTAKTIAQTVKFLDLKQACIEREKEIEEFNTDYKLKIEETGETKKIAGLKAHKAIVTYVHNPSVKFDIWYTKELGMENINAVTPYAQIKGVLLDYRVKKIGMELHFVAKAFKPIEVPDQVFEIPAAMKIVSPKEMEDFINNLQ